MDIKIVRGASTPEGTPGTLDTGEGFTCDTLELQWANNKTGISCIVPGTRKAWLWDSPTLGRTVVRIEDTDGRKDCLLHNGNWAGEGEGEVTQVHGCTELGHGYGQIKRPVDGNVTQFGIMHSAPTIDALVHHIHDTIGDAPFTVTHSWGDGCEPADLTDAQAVV